MMQYCVLDEHERPLVPHAKVVGAPLEPPELVAPELVAPLDAAPELVAPLDVAPELVVELVLVEEEGRPLEELLEALVCVLLLV